ncbi:hypothetical protein AJ88_25345 [Mesorhizobium amorphae CCBAU 01583]|nr:hypothetical protein AJ88_25345 [Mesorhizobium amorphae CCBAU 01583]
MLTKRMAEDLTEYLHERGIRVRYMHSDIDTLERIEILRDLRLGAFDVLVGINLLREGLDIPECGFVAILDADKEGFLRSETSLIQTIGRAARNVDGKVILYADQVTGSMERAMAETNRRREKQMEWNAANGITPESVKSRISDILDSVYEKDHVRADISQFTDSAGAMIGNNLKAHLDAMEKQMRDAATNLDFEKAARIATRSSGCARWNFRSPTIRWPNMPTWKARFRAAKRASTTRAWPNIVHQRNRSVSASSTRHVPPKRRPRLPGPTSSASLISTRWAPMAPYR